MVIDILTLNLPSRGWKSGLPESFEMEKFSGRHTMNIAMAAQKDDMEILLTQVLPDCLSIPIDSLTINDAHHLLFLQRMLMNHASPVVVNWTCRKPLFRYSSGVFNTIQGDIPALDQFPCENFNQSIIDDQSCAVAVLDAASDEFDLARMRHYHHTLDENALFNWHAAHMGPNFDANIARLESQQDLELWTRLSAWVIKARHGLSTQINVTCDHCGRPSGREWDMRPRVFINA